jgi:aminopeptidase N
MTRVLEVRAGREAFRFVDVPEPPVPSLLRGFSAPVILDFPYADEDLALLAAHDSDDVNRWAAAQQCMIDAMLRLASDYRACRTLALPRTLAEVVRGLVNDVASDPSLLALAIAPPDTAYVASLEPAIDVDAMLAARNCVVRGLAHGLAQELEAVVRRLAPREAYAPVQSQIGPRRLRNACLRYLGEGDAERSSALALAQFEAADNMTDAVGALAALRDGTSAAREDLYARFEARWHDEPLVLDKWFALQATAQRDDALARVKSLLAHPRFNARNPNRVRALVGAFALRNFRGFNAADGSGYAFTADQVLLLDPSNPQLASTLAGAFSLWKRYTEPRRSAMQAALSRIAESKSLSPDVTEVATRTLGD